MSKNKRRWFSADFKAKVALEALKGEQTLSELAARLDFHPNMIAQWKRQAIEGMAEVFSSKEKRREEMGEAHHPSKLRRQAVQMGATSVLVVVSTIFRFYF